MGSFQEGFGKPGYVGHKLRYSIFLPQSSPANAPATLPKSQKVKTGIGKMKNCTLQKIRFENIEGT